MRIVDIDRDRIKFDNGRELTYYHEQECCEHVYADFESLKTTPAMSYNFPENPQIELVPDAGVRVEGFFIPCYNYQNGYYSSDLVLQWSTGETINVTSAIEDCIG